MNESREARSKAFNSKAGETSSVECQGAELSEKRLRQHQQWMRVMMDGQSTPDNRYQKSADH